MEWIINLSVLVLVLGMTYALASEGLWGAALMFMNSLFAGLIALNFYEPLAGLMAQASFLASYADTLSLLGLFTVSLLVLRLATEYLGPTMIRMPSAIYHIGRWTFGFAASCLTMGILLLGFHTAPVHKKMFYGLYSYNLKPPFGMGLDWQWLGLFQYTTGYIFAQYGTGQVDPFKEFEDARVFDPRGRWLIDHQNQRPYGTEGTIPEPPQAAGSAEGGAAGEGGEGGVPGAPGPAPAGPPGPGIPGGTAGAAAGLAPTNP